MIKKFLLALLALTCMTTAEAAEVSQQQAIYMAKTKVSGDVSNVKTVACEGQKAYYVVQFAEGGWVLVSADDASYPFIGYSTEGIYQTEGQPENVKSMMDIYGRQVIENKQATDARRHAGWEQASLAKARANAESSDKIDPLIQVNWNQTGSFQKYCPGTGKNQAVVGCVAVGMAQAMSVAQWPSRPIGEFSYKCANYGQQYINYDNEPDYNWGDILSGANGKDDVARFLWHCGVAVSMDYGADGSGTQTSYIPAALMRNFSYPRSVKYYSRDGFSGSDDEWKELILTELQEGRAVAYSGHDPKGNYGHCFNLDGYDGEFFHVNWGWGGSNNGYFPLNGLKDAKMGMNYTDGQGVVVGIRPPSEKPSDIHLSSQEVQAGLPVGTLVCNVTVESEATNPVYKYELHGPYSARQHRYLSAPFEIVDNRLVTTEELEEGEEKVTITATNVSNGGSVERTFTIHVINGPTGVSDVVAVPVGARQYYSTTGMQLNTPAKGLNIIRQRMTDGTTKTIKVFKK